MYVNCKKMTVDKETQFVFKCNVSACSEEFSTNMDLAWITVCGHIFCANCGSTELSSLPLVCPFCSHQLNSPYDIMKCDIFPPSHFIKMVLMGLNPEDCLEAARSGIQFWQTQYNLQLGSSETLARNARQQAEEAQSQQEEKITELNREIALLREECQQLKEELGRQTTVRLPSYVVKTTENSKGNPVAPSPSSSAPPRKTYPAPSIPQYPHQQQQANRGFQKKQFLGKF